jgi:hydrogenase nickel incorporation protein HypA/HybF
MHEVAIMEEAVRLAVESARKSGASRVLELRLRVGALSGVVPEALQFAFDVVCHGTPAEGATLVVEPVAAVGWCPDCQAEYSCDHCLSECPRCQNLNGELRRGRELEISSVEIS